MKNKTIRNAQTISESILQWYKQLAYEKKTAFFSAFGFGILVHLIAITGWLFNWDTTLYEPQGWLILQGKWAWDFLYALDAGDYLIPMNRITSLIAIGLASALLVEIFGVKSKLWSGLVGACMVSFPSIMCAFSFGVGFWPVAIAVFSLWIIWKFRGWVGFLCSSGVLAFALGVYQSHIGFVAAGMVLLCIFELLKEESTVKKVLLLAVRYLAVLGAGIGLYYIILKIALRGQQLAAYQNIDKIEHITFSGLVDGIRYGYKVFFSMFLSDAYGTGYSYVVFAYRSLLVLTLIGLGLLIKKSRVYKKPLKFALMMVLIALYPLAVHAVALLSQGATSHWIMMYSFVMLPVAFIAIAYNCELVLKEVVFSPKDFAAFLRAKGSLLYQWCCCLCCFLLCWFWWQITDEGYLKLRIAYEGVYQQLTDMVDDIYENEDYQNGCTTVAIIGGGTPETVFDFMPQYSNYTGIAHKNLLYSYLGIPDRFLIGVLNIPLSYATTEQKQAVLGTPEFEAMPCYPEKGYIQEINEVLVVKM